MLRGKTGYKKRAPPTETSHLSDEEEEETPEEEPTEEEEDPTEDVEEEDPTEEDDESFYSRTTDGNSRSQKNTSAAASQKEAPKVPSLEELVAGHKRRGEESNFSACLINPDHITTSVVTLALSGTGRSILAAHLVKDGSGPNNENDLLRLSIKTTELPLVFKLDEFAAPRELFVQGIRTDFDRMISVVGIKVVNSFSSFGFPVQLISKVPSFDKEVFVSKDSASNIMTIINPGSGVEKKTIYSLPDSYLRSRYFTHLWGFNPVDIQELGVVMSDLGSSKVLVRSGTMLNPNRFYEYIVQNNPGAVSAPFIGEDGVSYVSVDSKDFGPLYVGFKHIVDKVPRHPASDVFTVFLRPVGNFQFSKMLDNDSNVTFYVTLAARWIGKHGVLRSESVMSAVAKPAPQPSKGELLQTKTLDLIKTLAAT